MSRKTLPGSTQSGVVPPGLPAVGTYVEQQPSQPILRREIMSSVERYRPPCTSGRTSRASQSIAGIDAWGSVQLARLDVAAEIQLATAHEVTYVSRGAMLDAGMLTALEQQLALSTPAASGRLAAIADVAALALTEVVADTATMLRRL